MEALRVDAERAQVAIQRSAMALDSRGGGRGRAEHGDGIA